jgi:hypothetical protein
MQSYTPTPTILLTLQSTSCHLYAYRAISPFSFYKAATGEIKEEKVGVVFDSKILICSFQYTSHTRIALGTAAVIGSDFQIPL